MWERNDELFNFDAPENSNIMKAIATYMDDDIREDCHFEYAPCSNTFFIEQYLKRDPEFEDLLWEEFGIRNEWRVYDEKI